MPNDFAYLLGLESEPNDSYIISELVKLIVGISVLTVTTFLLGVCYADYAAYADLIGDYIFVYSSLSYYFSLKYLLHICFILTTVAITALVVRFLSQIFKLRLIFFHYLLTFALVTPLYFLSPSQNFSAESSSNSASADLGLVFPIILFGTIVILLYIRAMDDFSFGIFLLFFFLLFLSMIDPLILFWPFLSLIALAKVTSPLDFSNEKRARDIIENTNDQELLAFIACNTKIEEIAISAARKIKDENLFPLLVNRRIKLGYGGSPVDLTKFIKNGLN
jgi:hypothetical protein